jgi:hypothetical protein
MKSQAIVEIGNDSIHTVRHFFEDWNQGLTLDDYRLVQSYHKSELRALIDLLIRKKILNEHNAFLKGADISVWR